MRLLLDTTVLIDVLRRRGNALTLIAEAAEAGHDLGTSAINVAEVHSGLRGNEGIAAREFLETLECYPVTASIAGRGGDLRNEWARKGISIGLADAVIAATALEHGLVLVTDNRKDFPMQELRFFPLARA
jgi:predicted nucleic acid-binding protein